MSLWSGSVCRRNIQIAAKDVVRVVGLLDLSQPGQIRAIYRPKRGFAKIVRVEVVDVASRAAEAGEGSVAVAAPRRGACVVHPVGPLPEDEDVEAGLPE